MKKIKIRAFLFLLFFCFFLSTTCNAEIRKDLELPYTCDPVNKDAIYELLKNKPEYINSVDSIGRTPLFYMISTGDEEAAIDLINRGADLYQLNLKSPGQTAIHMAAQFNRIKVVKKLLQVGLSVNQKSLNEYGVTPLHDAALEGHPAMVQFLIDQGADVNIVSDDGWTALDDAYQNRKYEVIKILETYGGKREKQ